MSGITNFHQLRAFAKPLADRFVQACRDLSATICLSIVFIGVGTAPEPRSRPGAGDERRAINCPQPTTT